MKAFFSHVSTTSALFVFCLLLSLNSVAQKKQHKETDTKERNKTEDGTIHLRIEKYENGKKKVYEHTYKDGELIKNGFSQGFMFNTNDSLSVLKLFGGGSGDTSIFLNPSGNMFFNLNDSAFANNQFIFRHNLDSLLQSTHSMVFNFNHSLMPDLDSLLSNSMEANSFIWHDLDKNLRLHIDTLTTNSFDFKWDHDLFKDEGLEMRLDKEKYDVEEVEVNGKKMIKIKPKEAKKSSPAKDSKKRSEKVQPLDDLLNLSTKPASGIVNLLFDVPSDGTTLITLTNANGKEVYREKVKTRVGVFTKSIDLNKEGRGVYLVEVRHNGKSISKKIVVQ
jgi:hypothetical protein